MNKFIGKYKFLAFLGLFAFLVIACFTTSVGYDADPKIVWDDSVATAVPYYVNPDNVPTGLDFEGAVQAGSQIWNDVQTSYFAFSYQGTSSAQGEEDGINNWWWNETGEGMDENTLGTNRYLYYYYPDSDTREIYEFDVEINGTKNWVWEENPSSGLDIQHTITHEAGHALVLGHSDDPNAIMYAYYHESRDLAQDDIDGITYLYPNNVTPSPSPSPSPSPTATSTSSGGGSGGGGCFIATAAYNSYMHDDVIVLRDFRDRVLMKSYPGRQVVKLYYTYSPPIAEKIGSSPVLKFATRTALVPVVLAIKDPYKFGFLILIAGICITLAIKRYAKSTN